MKKLVCFEEVPLSVRSNGKPLKQESFRDFAQRLLPYLFQPGDHVCVAENPSGDHPLRAIQPNVDAALSWLIAMQHMGKPNLLAGISAFDGTGHYTELNCVQTQAMLLDMDYGELGHKKPSPFKTYEDALGYLLTLPIQPTCAWHTGHGIQAFYKLSEPYLFPKGRGAPDSLKRFTSVGQRLGQLCMSDGTYTPAHLFRLPLTVNSKPGIAPVLGELLWFEEGRTYAFAELEQAVARYGFPEKELQPGEQRAPDKVVLDLDPEEPALDVPYEQLPEDLQSEIEDRHEDRSGAMFGLIGLMVRSGYSDQTIQEAIPHGLDFKQKYGTNLKTEIKRCIEKIRSGKYTVYSQAHAAPIEHKNVPLPVPLSECAALPVSVEHKLGQYCSYPGIERTDTIRQAARFHEHLFTQYRTGVMETPCGFGKSTWALSHMAAHASPSNRYLYVVETVEALYRAADILKKLTDVGVGRVHGFNEDTCFKLCGQRHSWRQCSASAEKSVCRTCAANAKCPFFNRSDEERRPILVMAHNGFIQQLERNTGLLDDANVIVDEDLNGFITHEFSHADLKLLRQYASHVNPDLGAIFPHSTLAHADLLAAWELPPGVDTVASRNYVFQDEQATSALSAVYDSLRKAAGTGLKPPTVFGEKPGESDRAKDVLFELLNVVRPSKANDAAYAFREAHPGPNEQDRDIKYVLKKSRFRLDTERSWRKLWILNASAQLSPTPYPENMGIYTCPDLKPNSELVALHVVSSNPMGSKRDVNIETAGIINWLLPHLQHHKRVFVSVNKDAQGLEQVRAQFARARVPPELVVRPRGRIKGINDAGDCTLAYLVPMSLFTTVDDCALHAALTLRRTFPDMPKVFNWYRKPHMPGGRFEVPAMRDYYALSSLDQIYQAIWRTAVRNGQRVEAIIAVPDPEWLVALWQTVMPGFVMGTAYQLIAKPKPEDSTAYHEGIQAQYQAGQIDADRLMALTHAPVVFFEADRVMQGLQIVNAPPGSEFKKTDVGAQFGYSGDQAWKANKKRILSLLSPFFEEGGTNRMLRRKKPQH